MQQGSINNWRSSNFFPQSDHPRIASLITKHSIIYCLEFATYYDHQSEKMVDKVPSIGFSLIVNLIEKDNSSRI
jgi:cytokinin dehydrogenase